MVEETVRARLAGLTTAHLADACFRAGSEFGTAPPNLGPIHPAMTVRGPAVPVRHYGSVDIFLETIDSTAPDSVLVIDNAGREDDACIGDLVAMEAQAAGLAGLVVWGLHRDTTELIEIGLPVFSLGATPVGPQRLDLREPEAFSAARLGDLTVRPTDWVVGDSDGVIILAKESLERLVDIAEDIRDAEHRQARGVREGRSLREQLDFLEYKKKAAEDPSYTLRQHLLEIGGAIET